MINNIFAFSEIIDTLLKFFIACNYLQNKSVKSSTKEIISNKSKVKFDSNPLF